MPFNSKEEMAQPRFGGKKFDIEIDPLDFRFGRKNSKEEMDPRPLGPRMDIELVSRQKRGKDLLSCNEGGRHRQSRSADNILLSYCEGVSMSW